MASRTLYLPVMIAAAVAVACLVVLSAVSEKAEASFPGQNGKIAYESNGVIYTINPNGSGKTRVTRGYDPSYSPDGKTIAYVSLDSGFYDHEIYTIKVGGGGKSRVTNNATSEDGLSWGSRP